MQHINKPKAVREALGLTHTEAGQIIMGIPDKRYANNLWRKMERDNETEEHLSNGTRQHLNLILMLIMCRELHTPGCSLALDKWIKLSETER